MRRPLLLTTPVPAVLVLSMALGLTACSSPDPAPEPVPSGTPSEAVEAATDPGTDLELGDSATLVWQPAADLTGMLEVSVDAVAEQRQSVFDGWVRDDVMAAARPYFVTVTMTNTGETDLGGQAVPLYLRDDNGALGAPWTLGGDFTACQSGPIPAPFAPAAETEMCLVYLVPDGARVEDMVFEPIEGYDPISWTGEVTKPEGRGKAARKRTRDERGNG